MIETNYMGTVCTSSKTTMLEMEAVETVAKIAQETKSVNFAKNESLMIVFSFSILR